jgi:formylmethanofuran dehydrogenase subunit E
MKVENKKSKGKAVVSGIKFEIEPFSEVVKFHGHICPGLVLGYRAANISINELSCERDIDEDLVTIVENDACGIDAIQVVTGCTIGKGNLIFRNYGKSVYTFIKRSNGDAVRVSLRDSFNMDNIDPTLSQLREKVLLQTASAEEKAEFHQQMEKVSDNMMTIPDEVLFDIKHVKVDLPEKARIFQSVRCARCGEKVAESMARVQNSDFVCIPCYGEYSRGW